MDRALVTLATEYLGSVADIDYRFEQLGDFINDYFEVYFPWVFGTIIAWTNDLLQDSGVAQRLPKTVPANIRWGVANSTALELMIGGVQSRSLAMRVANAWETEEGDGGVRSWIRSMNLTEWQQKFQASPAELRNLLELSRRQGGSVAARLISEETAELEVESNISEFPESHAWLAPADDSVLAIIGIRVGAELVGYVRTGDQADIRELLDTGLPFVAKFRASSGQGFVEFRLVDPEA